MQLITQVITTLLALLPKDKFKEIADALLDTIEDKIAASETKLDDAILLPLITKARELLDIPDGDD